MKTYRVEFTPDARQDILDHAQYIAGQEHNNTYALAWYEGMYAAVMSLKEMPQRCPMARENDAFEQEIRQLVYGSHRAIFSMHDDQGLVAIHRVWHTSRRNAQPEQMPGLNTQDEP